VTTTLRSSPTPSGKIHLSPYRCDHVAAVASAPRKGLGVFPGHAIRVRSSRLSSGGRGASALDDGAVWVFCCSASHTSHLFDARIHHETAHDGLSVRCLRPACSHVTTRLLRAVTGRSHSKRQSMRPIAHLLELCRTAPTYSPAAVVLTFVTP
jgi:hypothetical protein